MKRIIFTLLATTILSFANPQQSFIDSIHKQISITKSDTIKLVLTRMISRIYSEMNSDSAYYYAKRTLELAQKLKLRLVEASAMREMGYALMNMGNYPRSLQTILSALAIAQDPKSEDGALTGVYPGDDPLSNHAATPHAQRLAELGWVHQIMGILYGNTNNYEKAMFHHREAVKWTIQSGNIPLQSVINMTVARIYLTLKKGDSALLTEQKAYDQAMQSGYERYLGSVLLNMGRIHAAQGNKQLAAAYYKKALAASANQNYYPRGVVASNLLLAEYYHQNEQRDSGRYYIRNALTVAEEMNTPELLQRCYTAMAKHYKTINNSDSTVKYQALIIKMNDNLFNSKQAQQFQNIEFDEQQRVQALEKEKEAIRNRNKTYTLVAGLGIFLFIALFLYQNNRQKQKTNRVLATTLDNLKSTQAQLIQSEKMASLGELSAGIAHEIQNPLNFVNNFSEVNKELIEEMKEEIEKRNYEEVKALAQDIESNEEKISHHGKRADAIVKGMLQHSLSSNGLKEPTDINTLADEYLRLAYHGLRAKDKSFNASIKTEFDQSIGKININRQDIGRVVLNLINNAFYAVDEKKKQLAGDFQPTVSLVTKKVNGKVELRVKDNGNGIPQSVLQKIFQPFFTTKPPGQGTGLGLSLAYDIVKAHGGELKVETKEGEGAEFTVQLLSK